jgi:hypothetical protein
VIGLKELQGQVRYLVDDLRGQVAGNPELRAELRQEHLEAQRAERTAGTFESWLEDVLDQAAVAWVLGCVFVRFCEDNSLVEPLWIGGPEPVAPAARALENRQAYLIEHHRDNDRHWLRTAFGYLGELRPTSKIFDQHNPVWRFDISGEAAEVLSDFFRRGDGCESLRDEHLETRFLGDLYQELSAYAKKTYALLQTPDFVEEFILDRTFEPAVAEFGLPDTSVIDPTCGSGHFLLGAFHRLVKKWQDREPNGDIRVLTERALGQVTGVDLNPFAVAIARFRLLIAAMKVCDHHSLERAPTFPVRVATGDSLLEWGELSQAQGDLVALAEDRPVFAYASEDSDLLKDYLRTNQYTVVVGNPPYITVADKARNNLYRRLYPTVCHRQYQLTVPFAKRFFDLARRADQPGESAGYVGQITGNAFMKREFGKHLIENYFAHWVELTEVIDTSGAYIPGHGTPTVILIGRANSRRRSEKLRAVLGIKGEPTTPEIPADGKVWQSILQQIDDPGSESSWISSADLPRTQLDTHPWSLSGGGAVELLNAIVNRSHSRLGHTAEIGFSAITGEDDAFLLDVASTRRTGVERARPIVAGEGVRDYGIKTEADCIFPYGNDLCRESSECIPKVIKFLWLGRRVLQVRRRFGIPVEQISGLEWYDIRELYRDKVHAPSLIAYGEVATHNHFVLDSGGKVFNRTAPVIKLPEGASEDDHLRLLGLLNSSTACFWLKQVCFPKGGSGIGRGIQPESWMERMAFNATNVERFPLPSAMPVERAREIDGLAQRLAAVSPAAVAAEGVPTRGRLAEARDEYHSIRARMIALQEELDWEVYQLYGLLDEDLTTSAQPELKLGERAFEISMARRKVDTQWFARHGSTAIVELPEHWPAAYQELVERRIAVIESDRNIGLIERPECKRRWAGKSWDELRSDALRDWLLDRLEAPELWGSAPVPLSVAQLADRLRGDQDFRSVLDLWEGYDDYDLVKVLGKLVAEEHVPNLPAQRYKPSGLRKRAQWERTWALQRREDAGERVTIEVPPKYASADFVKPSYWRARGKLDVPKERFISYPKAGRDGDSSELLGWAGWDHLAQAQALAAVYLDRRGSGGWPADRLLPLLAGIVELEPWLKQWHGEPQAGFPDTPAAFFAEFVDGELARLDADRATLTRLRGVEDLV